MKPTTDKQQQILDFIKQAIAKTGKPPSYRAIGSQFGISVNAVVGHLNLIEKKGCIRRSGAYGRGFRMLTN